VTKLKTKLLRWGGAAAVFMAVAGLGLFRYLNRFDAPFDESRLAVKATSAEPLGPGSGAPVLRAFYSGHSLSDGVPEQVLGIAESLGRKFDFEFQSIPGSPIRKRTKGNDPKVDGFPGLKSGRNRTGNGLDVEAALKHPWEALVVTERHDLPYAAIEEQTAVYLRVLHDRAIAGNAKVKTLLYHGWLPIDFERPEAFVEYERAALVLWECVASAVNKKLASEGRSDRIVVLPGATALADLVEKLAKGEIKGAPGGTAAERVKTLFSDQVHLTKTGRYLVSAAHFAALFGVTPEGAAVPPEVPPELGRAMQKLAWEHVSAYATRARGAAAREMDVCRDYATRVMVPRFYEHTARGGALESLRNVKRKLDLQRVYADPQDPKNPFR
jgi:hypothetical protein